MSVSKLMGPIDSQYSSPHIMEVNVVQQLFG